MIMNLLLASWVLCVVILTATALFSLWVAFQELRHWYGGSRWAGRVITAHNSQELQQLIDDHNAECRRKL